MVRERILAFQDRFNEAMAEGRQYCCMSRAVEFQEEAVRLLQEVSVEGRQLKNQAAEEEHEDAANTMLAFLLMIEFVCAELQMWIYLKRDDPDQAWEHLVTAQDSVRFAMLAHPCGRHVEPYVEQLHALEHLLFPPQMFNSIGFVIVEDECSLCGAEYGTCNHIQARPYMGEMCSRIITKSKLLEISIVKEPVSKRHRATSLSHEGRWRNVMTWRIRDDKDGVTKEGDTP